LGKRWPKPQWKNFHWESDGRNPNGKIFIGKLMAETPMENILHWEIDGQNPNGKCSVGKDASKLAVVEKKPEFFWDLAIFQGWLKFSTSSPKFGLSFFSILGLSHFFRS
jgi:hypothetical protein